MHRFALGVQHNIKVTNCRSYWLPIKVINHFFLLLLESSLLEMKGRKKKKMKLKEENIIKKIERFSECLR